MLRPFVMLVCSCVMAFAASEEQPVGVEDMIPAAVKALPEPELVEFQGGLRMAVTTTSDLAQAHVVAGLNQLHGGWEFEAARHFAVALKRDPNCLLAHWGMTIALLAPNPETGKQRDASIDRLIDLVNAGAGNELERGYAYGLIQYFKEGPGGAADAFRKLSERFQNDLQATIFTSLFGRGGYNELGAATPDQERSEKMLEDLLKRFPDSTLLMHALLTVRAEAPDLNSSLPLARKLCQLAPNYPPYFHVLGHYEWRTGHPREAAAAFSRASELFEKWMQETGAGVADCPGWVMSECYRCVAMASYGDTENALAAASVLASKKFSVDRAASSGARMLLWEGKSLSARLLLSRGAKGDAGKALESLPTPKEMVAFKEKSLAYWWMDGLRLYADGLRLVELKNFEEAAKVSDAITHFGEQLMRVQQTASVGGERSLWNRCFRGLEVLACDLRGRLALAGPKDRQGSAYNWFRSATDRQTLSSQMLPPAILTPMAMRLGECQLVLGKPEEAVEAYEEALRMFPNDMASLKGLLVACDKAQKPELAAETRKKIEALATER